MLRLRSPVGSFGLLRDGGERLPEVGPFPVRMALSVLAFPTFPTRWFSSTRRSEEYLLRAIFSLRGLGVQAAGVEPPEIPRALDRAQECERV